MMTTEELKNAAGFKAVDAEGKELGIVALSDIVSAVKQELQPSGVARASVAALSEVSAQAATDTYEDQLPQKTDVTWIRGLDESGNPVLISKQSLVSVAEGLIPKVSLKNDGLAARNMCYAGTIEAPSILKMHIDNVTWGYDLYVIYTYDNGGCAFATLLVPLQQKSNKSFVRIEKDYGLNIKKDNNGDIYIYSNSTGNYFISISLLSSYRTGHVEILSINRTEIESMDLTDVDRF